MDETHDDVHNIAGGFTRLTGSGDVDSLGKAWGFKCCGGWAAGRLAWQIVWRCYRLSKWVVGILDAFVPFFSAFSSGKVVTLLGVDESSVLLNCAALVFSTVLSQARNDIEHTSSGPTFQPVSSAAMTVVPSLSSPSIAFWDVGVVGFRSLGLPSGEGMNSLPAFGFNERGYHLFVLELAWRALIYLPFLFKLQVSGVGILQ